MSPSTLSFLISYLESYYFDLTCSSSARFRQTRARFLASETAADDASRALEARQAEHLRLESEAFLARQMDELRALAEEQRKAGLLLDDGAPVRLAISAVEKEKEKEAEKGKEGTGAAKVEKKLVFGAEEEEELGARRRRGQLVKLDFEAAERERIVERLTKVRDAVSKGAEALWKVKVKWDALGEVSHLISPCCYSWGCGLDWTLTVCCLTEDNRQEDYTTGKEEACRVPGRVRR